MDEQKFEGEMLKAIMRRATQPERASYWKGVERGLQRAHFGAAFGTDDYHRFWLSLAENGGDESHREYGRGYRDGLALAALDATVPTASIDLRDDQAQLPLIDLWPSASEKPDRPLWVAGSSAWSPWSTKSPI